MECFHQKHSMILYHVIQSLSNSTLILHLTMHGVIHNYCDCVHQWYACYISSYHLGWVCVAGTDCSISDRVRDSPDAYGYFRMRIRRVGLLYKFRTTSSDFLILRYNIMHYDVTGTTSV